MTMPERKTSEPSVSVLNHEIVRLGRMQHGEHKRASERVGIVVVPQEICLEAVASQLIGCIVGVDIEEASAATSVGKTLRRF